LRGIPGLSARNLLAATVGIHFQYEVANEIYVILILGGDTILMLILGGDTILMT